MLRLLRFTLWKYPPYARIVSEGWKGPIRRVPSPYGGSTFRTSAPRSAKTMVQKGPASIWVRSMILTPASGPSFMVAPSARPAAGPLPS